MPLTFVLDENARGPLWKAIQTHNQGGIHPLDAVRVGDRPDLPLQASDPYILAWAEQTGRILLTYDESSMPGHWLDHLQAGGHSPGVFIIREKVPLREIVEHLFYYAYFIISVDCLVQRAMSTSFNDSRNMIVWTIDVKFEISTTVLAKVRIGAIRCITQRTEDLLDIGCGHGESRSNFSSA